MVKKYIPWRQQSERGLRVTQNAYFSLITHTKQLLLVTFCDTTAGIRSETGRDEADNANTGRTDRFEC